VNTLVPGSASVVSGNLPLVGGARTNKRTPVEITLKRVYDWNRLTQTGSQQERTRLPKWAQYERGVDLKESAGCRRKGPAKGLAELP